VRFASGGSKVFFSDISVSQNEPFPGRRLKSVRVGWLGRSGVVAWRMRRRPFVAPGEEPTRGVQAEIPAWLVQEFIQREGVCDLIRHDELVAVGMVLH
jgi:hypothetical protein